MNAPVYNTAGLEADQYSEVAEQSVIGAVLLEADVGMLRKIIEPSDFFMAVNSNIFRCAIKVHDEGDQPDMVTIFEMSKKEGVDLELGYLVDLSNNTPGKSNAAAYAKIVKEKSVNRDLMKFADQIKSADSADAALYLMQEAAETVKAATAASGGAGFSTMSGSDGYDFKVNWLVRNFVPADSVGMIYGPGGSYKSFLGIDWGASVASGMEWAGSGVENGSVLYVAGEGQSGIGQRIRAWEIVNQRKARNLHRTTRAIDVTSTAQRKLLIATCKEIEESSGMPVRLVIFDTVNRCFGDGDENSTQDMTRFVQGCDEIKAETGASILCVHHSGKDATKGARGSSVLRNAMDYEYSVTRAVGLGYVLKCTKAKDFSEPEPLEMALRVVEVGVKDDGGQQITSLARTGDGRSPGNGVSEDVEDLVRYVQDSGDGVSYAFVRDHFMSMMMKEGQKSEAAATRAFQRMFKKAIDMDYVEKRRDFVYPVGANHSNFGGGASEF